MAVLTAPTNMPNPFAAAVGSELPPPGTFLATILDIKDEFGVMRKKFESDELEKVDLTTFLFGFRDPAGSPHKIASRQMRISGNEKSALVGFLKSILGRAPTFGWDYCDLKGSRCLLTVEHVTRRHGNGVYAAISALSPVPPGFGQPAPAPAPAMAPVPTPRPTPAPAPAPQPPPQRQTADQAAEDDCPF